LCKRNATNAQYLLATSIGVRESKQAFSFLTRFLRVMYFKNLLNPTEFFKLAPIVEEMPPERSGGGIGT